MVASFSKFFVASRRSLEMSIVSIPELGGVGILLFRADGINELASEKSTRAMRTMPRKATRFGFRDTGAIYSFGAHVLMKISNGVDGSSVGFDTMKVAGVLRPL